jgi:hypothetical protein
MLAREGLAAAMAATAPPLTAAAAACSPLPYPPPPPPPCELLAMALLRPPKWGPDLQPAACHGLCTTGVRQPAGTQKVLCRGWAMTTLGTSDRQRI